MNSRAGLDAAIKQVVDAGNCSGCGACVHLDPELHMALDAQGYLRPERPHRLRTKAGSGSSREAAQLFAKMCPGVQVNAQHPPGSRRHPQLGPVVQAWEAWATDPQTRFVGSSGGTLTALSAWLLETGQSAEVIGAQAGSRDPRQTVSVRIMSKAEALAAAGSRYAPVANAAHPDALGAGAAVVGKPCEVSALRALDNDAGGPGTNPILLSFFCAGTPSQSATNALVEQLGVPGGEKISGLRYRGNGWPGAFTVTRQDGSAPAASYDESWGKHLGPATQWRCKICPDGVGESADVTAGDFWRTDAHGYPLFADAAGVSALIARTERGRGLVLAAAAAGVLSIRALDLEALVEVQPLQRKRRSTLLGRLLGTRAAAGRVPRYRGFGLWLLACREPRESWRTLKGSYRRRKLMRPSA